MSSVLQAPGTVKTPSSVSITSGTAVQGPEQKVMSGVYVCSLTSNSGDVFVGDSTVSSTKHGMSLSPGGMTPRPLPVGNTNEVWVDGTNTGDKVGFLVV